MCASCNGWEPADDMPDMADLLPLNTASTPWPGVILDPFDNGEDGSEPPF